MATKELKSKWKAYNATRKQYRKQYDRKAVFKRLSYSANHIYKANKITAFDLWKIAKKQKLRCALTNHKLNEYNMSIDHITPKSKGGLNIPSNIRLVLIPINIAKQTMTDDEFVELCNSVVNHARGSGNSQALGVLPP